MNRRRQKEQHTDGHYYAGEHYANPDDYLLIALQTSSIPAREAAISLEELKELTRSADANTRGQLTLRVRQIDPKTYIGRGQVQEIRALAQQLGVAGIIFDEDFSPVQQRNLEDILELRVIGRTELILDIFARRAQTHEGKLQVELAQLQYLRPRLIGQGFVLSRLGGGIGTRGPGESRLEMDRRRIAARINHLQRELTHVRRARETQRKRRLRQEVLTVALVGYTNSGKSTLLRALTNADVHVEDRLFATLDPAAKRALLPDGRVAIFTDTVGFIHRLPTGLVEAFKATLEEVLYADLLLHVIDASSPTLEREIRTTDAVLGTLGADEKPRLRIFNKIDQNVDHSVFEAFGYREESSNSVAISALYGIGIHDLLSTIVHFTSEAEETLRILLPYTRGDLLSRIHNAAAVKSLEYDEDGVRVTALVDSKLAGELRPFIQPAPAPKSRR
ncbi:MAG: GTPase HflX [Candidatus Sumerlaeaceae bacterium]